MLKASVGEVVAILDDTDFRVFNSGNHLFHHSLRS